MSRSLALLASAVLLAALYATACGGRSPLARNLYEDPDSAGGSGGLGGSGGIGGTSVGGSAGMAGAGGVAGAGGGGTAGSGGILPTECLICAGTQCPDAVACLADPVCRDGLLCAVTGCISGGQPDVMCMLDCFDGDISAAIAAAQGLYCIIQNCRDECASVLPFDEA